MTRTITTVTPFNAVLGADATLAGLNANTFAFTALGDPITATFEEDDGVLGPGDTGTATLNGEAITFIGSGTMQVGTAVSDGGGLLGEIGGLLGGITDAVFDVIGDPVEVTVFEAGGQVFLILPDGPPEALLGLENLLVSFSLTADPAVIPCFAAGTLIRTPDGDVPVEDLQAGGQVLDTHDRVHEILWTGRRTVNLMVPRPEVRAIRPIRIRTNAFGAGRPYTELVVSPQHRIEVAPPALELVAGVPRGLCAARHLVGDIAYVDRQTRRLDYHHILCREHLVLVANGLPAESLFLGPQLRMQGLDPRALDEIKTVFPELLSAPLDPMEPALPFITRKELLAAGGPG
jgi:hypothetical protein